MSQIKPLNNTDTAVAALRERIIRGALAPGERLLEVPMSEELGISRTPLRQALLQLEREGLVERKPTTGFVVRRLTFADVSDAIELRGMLEGLAARRGAERGLSVKQLSQLSAILDRIDLALTDTPGTLDMEVYTEANRAFHAALIEAAASPFFRAEIARTEALPFSSPSAFLLNQRNDLPFQRSLIAAQAQHRAVVDALSRREGARAEAIMREHARIALSNLEYIMQQDRSLRRHVPGLALVVD